MRIIAVTLVYLLIIACTGQTGSGPVKVLLISGRNNHDWKKTTPVIERIYTDSRQFRVDISLKPDTLIYNDFKKYDVIVSNWNTLPDTGYRMPKDWEDGFLRYMKEGGGALFIHAGASSFYDWDDYHRIGIGRFGKDAEHGSPVKGKVCDFDNSHPVTEGTGEFFIVDDILEKPDIFPGAKVIASVSVTLKNGETVKVPAVTANNFGKGRSIFISPGHNGRALVNSGLKNLILRSTQWAAHREVTMLPPSGLQPENRNVTGGLNWERTDTTISLLNNSGIVWQYNFNDRYGQPYFHPLVANNNTVTCACPLTDHPWHLGLWFSWKYINGVNYWEYRNEYKSEKTGFKAEGLTGVKNIDIKTNTDFSADILMELQYRPDGGEAVLAETRNLHISNPLSDGSYYIDHECIFTPLTEEVKLDRTPIPGEEGGMSWGGYAGLGIRFSQDFTSHEVIVPSDSGDFKKDNWFYMGFETLTGDTAGVCIFQNPEYTTSTTSWYAVNDTGMPFYFFTPAVIYDGPIKLKKGETLHLKYRIWVIPGKTGKDSLQSRYKEYISR